MKSLVQMTLLWSTLAMSAPSQAGILATPNEGNKALPPLSLTTHQKAQTTLAELCQERPATLLLPIYTSCPTVCPELTRQLQESFKQLSNAQQQNVKVVLISFETTDTPTELIGFRDKLQLAEDWTVAVGSEEETRALLDHFKYLYTRSGESDYIHSGSYFILNAQPTLLGIGSGPFEPNDLAPFLTTQSSFRKWLKNPSFVATWGILGFIASLLLIQWARKPSSEKEQPKIEQAA